MTITTTFNKTINESCEKSSSYIHSQELHTGEGEKDAYAKEKICRVIYRNHASRRDGATPSSRDGAAYGDRYEGRGHHQISSFRARYRVRLARSSS